MNLTREQYVTKFFEAAGNKLYKDSGDLTPYINVFSEELNEFNEALAEFVTNPTDETRRAMIKEWADVQYTLSNFSWFFDFDGEKAYRKVAENNLTKIVDGKVTRREDGKILKPEGYSPVDMTEF